MKTYKVGVSATAREFTYITLDAESEEEARKIVKRRVENNVTNFLEECDLEGYRIEIEDVTLVDDDVWPFKGACSANTKQA